MEGPKKISVDLSTTTGTGSVRRVSGDGASPAEGNSLQVSGNGATVSGSGVFEAASGQAKLGMMANGIRLTNGFFKEKPDTTTPDGIRLHTAALLLDGTEADNQFKELMTRASRGAESSSRTVSPHEVELGKQAVIPLDGPDAQFKDLLRSAFRLAAGRHAPITKETIINSFHEAQE
jgi:hypothetical protein